jgi:hypothetical protein
MNARHSTSILVPADSVDSKDNASGTGVSSMIAKRRPSSRAARAGGALLAVAMAVLLGVPAAQSQLVGPGDGLELNNPNPTTEVPTHMDARVTVLPFRSAPSAKALAGQSASATTIQTWQALVAASQDGGLYPFTLVGKDVRTPATNTHIKTRVIPVSLTFTDTGDVFDPSVKNVACGETQSALSGTLHGPVFKKHAYAPGGTKIGSTQYIDALQREEFWTFIQPGSINPHYHVLLDGKTVKGVQLSAFGFPVMNSQSCSALGLIDINVWDAYLQNSLFPALAASGVSPTTFPIFLLKNVVFYDGSPSNCCILGYHSAFNNFSFGGAAQTYGNADYDSTGLFGSAAQDSTVLSHEVAEWANDPYVNNPTPPWGHIGQVSGCQNNLEVGDPLTGTTFPVTMGRTTYHLQELAFFGWFFGFNGGVNGWYSTQGTFTSPSNLCF